MEDQSIEASSSAIAYALVTAALTVLLGLMGGWAMHVAYADENCMAGFGVPQLGFFSAPFVGAVVGFIRYNVLMSRHD